jgi:Ca-activated chloride channel family protein
MGRRRAASADLATGGDDRELDVAREQVREEVRRMHKAGPLGEVERREWLADLATRLKALVRHLRNQVPASALSPLKELLEAIEAGGAVDRIWDEAVTVLDAFAAGVGVAKPGR